MHMPCARKIYQQGGRQQEFGHAEDDEVIAEGQERAALPSTLGTREILTEMLNRPIARLASKDS